MSLATSFQERTLRAPSQGLLARQDMRLVVEDFIDRPIDEEIPTGFALVGMDVMRGDSSRLEAIKELLAANWLSEQWSGWLTEKRLGLLVPCSTISEADEFIENFSEETNLDRKELQVAVVGLEPSDEVLDEVSNGTHRLEQLFALPTPAWKRAMDLLGTGIGGLLLLPLFLILVALVKLTSRGPVLFTQARVGRGGEAFCMYKFRTMADGADAPKESLAEFNEQDGMAFKMSNDPRVTMIGRWLRKSSLDELPQLINVMRGDMSLVGPRPLPFFDWQPDQARHLRRLHVLPGLTGPWQVDGRSRVTFEKWMEMDQEYVENMSFWWDLKILAKTVPAVLSQRGAV